MAMIVAMVLTIMRIRITTMKIATMAIMMMTIMAMTILMTMITIAIQEYRWKTHYLVVSCLHCSIRLKSHTYASADGVGLGDVCVSICICCFVNYDLCMFSF